MVKLNTDGDDGHNKRLIADGITPKQEKAIIALLQEPTIPKAAQAAGVGVRSVHRWLTEPEFSRAYRRARRDAFSQAHHSSRIERLLARHALRSSKR